MNYDKQTFRTSDFIASLNSFIGVQSPNGIVYWLNYRRFISDLILTIISILFQSNNEFIKSNKTAFDQPST